MEDPGSKKGGGSASGDRNGDRNGDPSAKSQSLYFFPDAVVTEEQLRKVLSKGSREERAWAISHLLRYAQWADIWTYVSRDEVREIFPDLDLPANLRSAWGRMLKVEAPVG